MEIVSCNTHKSWWENKGVAPCYKDFWLAFQLKSGNTRKVFITDADIKNWEDTINKIMIAYPKVQTIIPGHGNFNGPELLVHTVNLLKEYKKKQ